MKKVFAAIGQVLLFFIFLGVFFAGSFLVVFHLDPFGAPHWFISHPTPTTTSYFVPSGLLLMTILYVIVFVVEALMKRLRTAGLWTSVAFILALVVGFASRFGFRSFPS